MALASQVFSGLGKGNRKATFQRKDARLPAREKPYGLRCYADIEIDFAVRQDTLTETRAITRITLEPAVGPVPLIVGASLPSGTAYYHLRRLHFAQHQLPSKVLPC